MSKKLILLFSLLLSLCSIHLYADTDDIYDTLQRIGYDNIQVQQSRGVTYIALEDNVFRGNYRGIGEALKALKSETSAKDTIMLVILDDAIPKVTLQAVYHSSERWTIDSRYPISSDMQPFRNAVKRQSSFGKVDFVLQPMVELDSLFHDYNGIFAIDIAPSLEMTLWKGAHLSLQAILPVYNNFKVSKHNNYIRPGTSYIRQNILSNNKFNVNLTAGMFYINKTRKSDNRYGVDLQADYHLNERMDLGVQVGYTGSWYMEDKAWKFDNCDKLSAFAKFKYYEPLINCQFVFAAGQFVYGDAGIRLDVVRRMAEYSISGYMTYCKDENGVGLNCSIPIGPKKKMRHRPVSLNLSEFMNWDYSFSRQSSDHRCIVYSTLPDGENTNIKYWQPEYISKYVQKYLNNEIK